MDWKTLFVKSHLDACAVSLFREQRNLKRLDGWFLTKEIEMNNPVGEEHEHPEVATARLLEKVVEHLPLALSDYAVFAGTQNDAFAKTYALINPTFNIETFEGYCDPVAVFDDIEPDPQFTRERIDRVRRHYAATPYVTRLKEVYDKTGIETKEVAYFVEQVTGHVIADFRGILEKGVAGLQRDIDRQMADTANSDRKGVWRAMKIALGCAVTLASRYAALAEEKASRTTDPEQRARLELMARTLKKVPLHGAESLYEAIQSYIIAWQTMCLEQSPNPYAFSAGNVDRIFEPYRRRDGVSLEQAAALFKHLLVFFNVGDRSWAISQNLLVGGKDTEGHDLTTPMTYAVLDAYNETNYPQPILSVRLHRKTPPELYEALGDFLFSPGKLTPSFFNDESVFEILKNDGVEPRDITDYAVAGCQEPLVMGRDNGNTTNSWLNLGKILELTLNDGRSLISGEKIGLGYRELGLVDTMDALKNIREAFDKQLAWFVDRMVEAANGCSEAVANLRVPFLSALMGGIESGIDMRDVTQQGTRYNGSGCLIHGLSVVADSFTAVDELLRQRPDQAATLLEALRDNFEGHEDLRRFLLAVDKFGNNLPGVDAETVRLADKVSDVVNGAKNYLGNPFRADWSTPSTHLLYGYWVGATPDGRKAREMLNYGVDPLYGEANKGLGFRILSTRKLPFEKMRGGYASHFGINPGNFPERSTGEKGLAFARKIIAPLFFGENDRVNPFYLYVNVTTPDMLRKVKDNPQKYAPSGVYIMRIHGTFVNFLDLSPDIQNDIILRLDLQSTNA